MSELVAFQHYNFNDCVERVRKVVSIGACEPSTFTTRGVVKNANLSVHCSDSVMASSNIYLNYDDALKTLRSYSENCVIGKWFAYYVVGHNGLGVADKSKITAIRKRMDVLKQQINTVQTAAVSQSLTQDYRICFNCRERVNIRMVRGQLLKYLDNLSQNSNNIVQGQCPSCGDKNSFPFSCGQMTRLSRQKSRLVELKQQLDAESHIRAIRLLSCQHRPSLLAVVIYEKYLSPNEPCIA